MEYLRLGINIDHVATVRNARGGKHPEILRAALLAEKSAADGITVHLREDRRHIIDEDVIHLKDRLSVPLNLEMAATKEMFEFALKVNPNAICIVPEKREELTTEGGLDINHVLDNINLYKDRLSKSKIRISLFLEPDIKMIDVAAELGVDIIEFHTGRYSDLKGILQKEELEKIKKAIKYAHSLNIECHAGHGLDYDNVADIASIAELKELNIGHFLIGEAIFVGLEESIRHMRKVISGVRDTR